MDMRVLPRYIVVEQTINKSRARYYVVRGLVGDPDSYAVLAEARTKILANAIRDALAKSDTVRVE